jgi:hypothetical protein
MQRRIAVLLLASLGVGLNVVSFTAHLKESDCGE